MSLLTRNLDLFDPLDAEVGGHADPEGQLAAVAAYVKRCELCALYRNRTHAVPGEGSAGAGLMIVGEGPGETEDALGRPFVGKAGELLDRILEAATIPRPSVFITNIVKCRAADMVGDRLQNRAPLSAEINSCRPYLVRQVEIIQPKVILCLGASAAKGIIDAAFNITEQRGQWFDGPFGSRIIATFHPAFILRRGGAGSGAKELKKLVWNDMKMVRDLLSAR
jgi:uracil-DNA glycosylase family protein